MIDTIHLLPPDLGPRSNPVLYGIAEAIAELLPPTFPDARRPTDPHIGRVADTFVEASWEAPRPREER